jgi:hypothetical protein
MKKYIYVVICLVSFIFAACYGDYTEDYSAGGSPESVVAKQWAYVKNYLAPGVEISDERPFPDMFSEKELILKAYSVMSNKGYFSLDNPMFTSDPRLLTAKIAKPLVIYFFETYGAGIGERIYVIADNGEVLLEQFVDPLAAISDDEFLGPMSGYASTNDRFTYHYITEDELLELIESQFSAQPDENPILVQLSLAGHQLSHLVLFWYFTVENVEYIVGAQVFKWNSTAAAGGVSNHAAISLPGENGVGIIGGERMARLDTRGGFYDVIRANKDLPVAGGFPVYTPPAEAFKWTAIPLK